MWRWCPAAAGGTGGPTAPWFPTHCAAVAPSRGSALERDPTHLSSADAGGSLPISQHFQRSCFLLQTAGVLITPHHGSLLRADEDVTVCDSHWPEQGWHRTEACALPLLVPSRSFFCCQSPPQLCSTCLTSAFVRARVRPGSSHPPKGQTWVSQPPASCQESHRGAETAGNAATQHLLGSSAAPGGICGADEPLVSAQPLSPPHCNTASYGQPMWINCNQFNFVSVN